MNVDDLTGGRGVLCIDDLLIMENVPNRCTKPFGNPEDICISLVKDVAGKKNFMKVVV